MATWCPFVQILGQNHVEVDSKGNGGGYLGYLHEIPRDVDYGPGDVPTGFGGPSGYLTEENDGQVDNRDNDAPVVPGCPPGYLEEKSGQVDSRDNDAPVVPGCPPGYLEEKSGQVDSRDNDAPVVPGCPPGYLEEKSGQVDSRDNDAPVVPGCPARQLE